MLIDRKPARFDPSKFEDRYEDALIEMIQAKIKGKKLPAKAPPPPQTNVVDLASLLRKSLEKEGGAKPRAKARREKAQGGLADRWTRFRFSQPGASEAAALRGNFRLDQDQRARRCTVCTLDMLATVGKGGDASGGTGTA